MSIFNSVVTSPASEARDNGTVTVALETRRIYQFSLGLNPGRGHHIGSGKPSVEGG